MLSFVDSEESLWGQHLFAVLPFDEKNATITKTVKGESSMYRPI